MLQERLRELQFMDIKERNYTTQLNQLLKMHLKSDLQQKPISWKNCNDPERTLVYKDLYKNRDITEYGVLTDVQTCLSNIRTDLDSFSNAEAYALMYSGYLQTHHEWNEKNGAEQTLKQEQLWKFAAIREYVKDSSKSAEIKKVLEVGSKLFFKVPFLNKTVKFILLFLLVTLLALAAWFLYENKDEKFIDITIKGVFFLVLFYFLGKIIKGIGFLVSSGSEIKKWLVLFALTILGWIVSNIYLGVFNRLYNKAGKLKA